MSNQTSSVVKKQPRECDILCGKDRRCQTHTGSRRFRKMIDSYQHQYQQATNKQHRMAITKEIYSKCSRSNCRFLKLNEKTQQWQEISPLAARDKISHALRGPSKAKSTTDKNTRRHHRRNGSDLSSSSLESIYSESTANSSWSGDADFSFLDDLVGNASLLTSNDDCTLDPLEPVPVRTIVHPLLQDLTYENTYNNSNMDPLPIDVTVDLSFLLQESHLNP